MHTIKILKHTSVSQISDIWPEKLHDDITFLVIQKSSFSILAEGVALGKLRDYECEEKKVFIELHEKTGNKDIEELIESCPIFNSIFGLELLRLSEGVLGSSTEPRRLRDALGSTIWNKIRNEQGRYADGHNAYFFSCSGYDVPLCLRGDSLNFPRFDYFLSNCKEVIPKLRGYEKFIDARETKLIEWLHSIAENAHEHGRFDGKKERGVTGYRGLILQKLIFWSDEDVSRRNDYPDLLRDYLERNRSLETVTIFNVVTVCDAGLGVHKTLGADYDYLEEKGRLLKAFERGISRRPKNFIKEQGFGLDQSITAANSLDAFYFLCSANLVASIDFTKHKEIVSAQFDQIGLTRKKNGTSVSIVWKSM